MWNLHVHWPLGVFVLIYNGSRDLDQDLLKTFIFQKSETSESFISSFSSNRIFWPIFFLNFHFMLLLSFVGDKEDIRRLTKNLSSTQSICIYCFNANMNIYNPVDTTTHTRLYVTNWSYLVNFYIAQLTKLISKCTIHFHIRN